MNRKVLVVYKSVTGFTREYAEMIAQEIDGSLLDLRKASAETMSNFDTVIFGGRLHAGTLDGLQNAKKLFQQSQATKFLVFATGAMPNDAKAIIDEMWNKNFSSEELLAIPHFYMPAGLRYEKMSLTDKMIMKMLSVMMKKKKDKNDYEKQLEEAIAGSCDISSKSYIMPLVSALKFERTCEHKES